MNHYVRALRPVHWSKSLLVAAAPIAAGVPLESRVFTNLAYTVIAFVAASSAVYLMNDVRDQEDDRRHPEKRLRPVASGAITKRSAALMAGVALLLSAGFLSMVGLDMFLPWSVYVAVNVAYSFGLKNVPILEIVLVASGFLVRLIAGSMASNIPISIWLFVCVGCASLMVVSGKRLAEKSVTQGSARRTLTHYTQSYLTAAIWILGLVLVVSYLGWFIWGIETLPGVQLVLRLLSVFAVGGVVVRYLAVSKKKIAETPELLLASDRFIALITLTWAITFLGANLFA